MNQDIHNFIQYLHQEKQTSENTEVSYERDLKKMILPDFVFNSTWSG